MKTTRFDRPATSASTHAQIFRGGTCSSWPLGIWFLVSDCGCAAVKPFTEQAMSDGSGSASCCAASCLSYHVCLSLAEPYLHSCSCPAHPVRYVQRPNQLLCGTQRIQILSSYRSYHLHAQSTVEERQLVLRNVLGSSCARGPAQCRGREREVCKHRPLSREYQAPMILQPDMQPSKGCCLMALLSTNNVKAVWAS